MPDVSREVSARPLVFQPRRHAVRVRVYALKGGRAVCRGDVEEGVPDSPQGKESEERRHPGRASSLGGQGRRRGQWTAEYPCARRHRGIFTHYLRMDASVISMSWLL